MNNHELIKALKYIPFDNIDDKLNHALNIKLISRNYYNYTLDMYRIYRHTFMHTIAAEARDTSGDRIENQSSFERRLCQYMHISLMSKEPDNCNGQYIADLKNNQPLRDLLFNPDNLDKHTKDLIEQRVLLNRLANAQGLKRRI
jgi:hypothetical protein